MGDRSWRAVLVVAMFDFPVLVLGSFDTWILSYHEVQHCICTPSQEVFQGSANDITSWARFDFLPARCDYSDRARPAAHP